ncbi:MAG: serine/threonine-protein kinase, partial [Gemmatimonadetes bacterium]|nr:serine/threonine-protein kinase [Gemmatimonadota bacterium]
MSDLLDRVRAAFGARFRVEREMETGGLTTAFAAQEVTSGRDVVLKVLRPEVTANLDVEQFLAAITPMRDLAHPHILSPYEAGETNGFLYYAVSHMGGVTVRDKLDTHGRAPIAQTVRIVRGVVDALAYAHGRGILHLGVRPENVLLAGGEVQLMDLGVVQAVHAPRSPELAAPDSTHVEYRAPEQVSGDAVDHRTDIYQVGALAYELLTGQPPGEGGFRAIVERR